MRIFILKIEILPIPRQVNYFLFVFADCRIFGKIKNFSVNYTANLLHLGIIQFFRNKNEK